MTFPFDAIQTSWQQYRSSGNPTDLQSVGYDPEDAFWAPEAARMAKKIKEGGFSVEWSRQMFVFRNERGAPFAYGKTGAYRGEQQITSQKVARFLSRGFLPFSPIPPGLLYVLDGNNSKIVYDQITEEDFFDEETEGEESRSFLATSSPNPPEEDRKKEIVVERKDFDSDESIRFEHSDSRRTSSSEEESSGSDDSDSDESIRFEHSDSRGTPSSEEETESDEELSDSESSESGSCIVKRIAGHSEEEETVFGKGDSGLARRLESAESQKRKILFAREELANRQVVSYLLEEYNGKISPFTGKLVVVLVPALNEFAQECTEATFEREKMFETLVKTVLLMGVFSLRDGSRDNFFFNEEKAEEKKNRFLETNNLYVIDPEEIMPDRRSPDRAGIHLPILGYPFARKKIPSDLKDEIASRVKDWRFLDIRRLFPEEMKYRQTALEGLPSDQEIFNPSAGYFLHKDKSDLEEDLFRPALPDAGPYSSGSLALLAGRLQRLQNEVSKNGCPETLLKMMAVMDDVFSRDLNSLEGIRRKTEDSEESLSGEEEFLRSSLSLDTTKEDDFYGRVLTEMGRTRMKRQISCSF